MVELAIPQAPEALTADWLTQALQAGGVLAGGRVVAIDAEPIAAGVGFLGKLSRLTLRYAGDAAGAPRTLIAKLPTLDPGARQLARMFRFYEREVRFYREFADAVAIKVPRAYHAAFDAGSGDFVLLLEDLAPATVGDQLAGCSPAQAEATVRALAGLHASGWDKPAVAALDWMPLANDPINLIAEPAYQQCWPAVPKFAPEVPTALLRIGERLAQKINRIQHEMVARPRTIVHGDCRLDNLFFGAGGAGTSIAAIDWQIAFRGIGTFDVGYFLCGNVATAQRRTQEMALLRLYHDALQAAGVRGYSYDDCLRDYRLSVLFCLVYVVISIGTLDPANARGLALFYAWLQRAGDAILDLDAAAVMPA